MIVKCNKCGIEKDQSINTSFSICPRMDCLGVMILKSIIKETKPRIPQFIELLEQMKTIHLKKNKDYASVSDPFENFKRSALISEWFNDPVDRSFTNLIGTKLARLATLLNKKEGPENESIEDSFLDLCTYCALWASYRKFNQEEPNKSFLPDNPDPRD